MKFSFAHNNINVKALDKSLAFYKEALGLEEVGHIDGEDGSFKIVYLGDGTNPHDFVQPHSLVYLMFDGQWHLH